MTNDVCHHGTLRRKCEPCDLAEELKECREALLKMEAENERLLAENAELRSLRPRYVSQDEPKAPNNLVVKCSRCEFAGVASSWGGKCPVCGSKLVPQ